MSEHLLTSAMCSRSYIKQLKNMFAPKWTFSVSLLTAFLICSATKEIKTHTREDVLLQCHGPRDADIKLVKWIRPNLKSEGFIFFFRDELVYDDNQHPSFKNRVKLKDQHIKDGDASVILKNVTIKDTGTYECYVGYGGSSKLIITIHLIVVDSGGGAGGTEDGEDEDGGKQSDYFGVAGAVSVIVMQVSVIVFVILRKVIKQHLYKPHFKQAGIQQV